MNGQPDGPQEARPTAGADFVKKIGPAGCALFLLLAVLVTALCLTAGRNPVPGYEPPHDTAYWAAHPQELAQELTDNVLPYLDYPARAEAREGGVAIFTSPEEMVMVRSALLQYFDESLFTFEKGEEP